MHRSYQKAKNIVKQNFRKKDSFYDILKKKKQSEIQKLCLLARCDYDPRSEKTVSCFDNDFFQ